MTKDAQHQITINLRHHQVTMTRVARAIDEDVVPARDLGSDHRVAHHTHGKHRCRPRHEPAPQAELLVYVIRSRRGKSGVDIGTEERQIFGV
ncbi:MAG: hypothetical protein QM757_44080 [Paludibaculum sp.]